MNITQREHKMTKKGQTEQGQINELRLNIDGLQPLDVGNIP